MECRMTTKEANLRTSDCCEKCKYVFHEDYYDNMGHCKKLYQYDNKFHVSLNEVCDLFEPKRSK